MISTKPIVVVRWNDAQSSATKVYTENETGYHAPIVMETLGWLLKDDDAGVSIVTEVFSEEGLNNYRGHTFVPRGMVIDVIHLPIKPVRSRKRAQPRSSQAVPPADVREVSVPDRPQGS